MHNVKLTILYSGGYKRSRFFAYQACIVTFIPTNIKSVDLVGVVKLHKNYQRFSAKFIHPEA